MTRRQLLSAAPAVVTGPGRRNVVFVLSDDHRYDLMGSRGHPWLKTPNLDRLAARGVLLRNAFVTTSLCSPSRASILTGQYAHAHGVLDNMTALPALATFPQLLRENGYRTALIGKWHMGGNADDPRPGFDRWVSFRGQGPYRNPTLNIDGVRRPVPGYTTDILTDEAIRFVDQAAGRPFLLYLGHKAVHAPCIPADRHRDLYQREPFPSPRTLAASEENYRGKPEWVRRQRDSWHGVDGMFDRKTNLETFYRDSCRTLMALDDSIGRLTDHLAGRGLLNDTLFLYMGDNGFQYGEHGLIDKRTMYEPSIRIPLIAHCPDLFAGGRQVDGMALNIDIALTILAATGTAIPGTMHGRSLLDLLGDRKTNWRSEFLYEYFWEEYYPHTPTIRGLRTDRYSYMRYYGIWDVDELYDLAADPDQTNNLLAGIRVTTQEATNLEVIRDPELKALVTDLESRKQRIISATGPGSR